MRAGTGQRRAGWRGARGIGLVAAVLAALAGASGAIAAASSAEKAIARAINLHSADVPGYRAQPAGGGGGADPINARLASCAGATGLSTHRGAVDATSPLFVKSAGLQEQDVQSFVEIERSPSVVRSDLASARSGRARACLRHGFSGLKFSVQGIQVKITHVRVTSLAVSAPGADGSVGIRIKLSITALSLSVPMTADVIGVGVGRDEITLATTAIAASFPRQSERSLSSLLVSRALANPH